MKYGIGTDEVAYSIENLKFSEKSVSTRKTSQSSNRLPTQRVYGQPNEYILNVLPRSVFEHVLLFVDQFDLCNLSLTCREINELSTARLYNRITIDLNCDFPLSYQGDSKRYIRECGMKYIHSSLIFTKDNLIRFFFTICSNQHLVDKIRFFIFDKCYDDSGGMSVPSLQSKFVSFFQKNSSKMNFLHISFIDFEHGIQKLTTFLSQGNIRQKIFKLFLRKLDDFDAPFIPACLTNLFLSLDETDLIDDNGNPIVIDLNSHPYNVFNSLFTLTCSTKNQMGLQIVKSIRLLNDNVKLRLKGLTIFHCHNENALSEEIQYTDSSDEGEPKNLVKFNKIAQKKLDFSILEQKFDLSYLSHLYLRVDCMEHKLSTCKCFEKFFNNFTEYSKAHGGLPKLKSFEVESFPSFEWLTPIPALENVLKPLGGFIKSLNSIERLTIDFSTPGFKMFDNDGRQPAIFINKMDESIMEEFFLSLFEPLSKITMNLKTLQLSDFLTSFIYYKADFYHSFLHTCQCWGCDLVLEKLKEMFYPITLNSLDEDDGNDSDIEETYYLLVGYILGKLQTDREVCVPIEDRTYKYDKYPIYKGQPHILHQGFHTPLSEKDKSSVCKCNIDEDPLGKSELNIDNLVTTYIVHQLDPMVRFLRKIFMGLDNLVIHGIHYRHDRGSRRFVPIFDEPSYPLELLNLKCHAIRHGINPSGPFGYFMKHRRSAYDD